VSAAEPATGQYVYCIISCGEPREFTSPGLGEGGNTVHTVHSMDLAAVVSESPMVEYDRSRRNMMAHTVVLEEVMREFTLLPVRFGTIAPSAETVQKKVLGRRHGELTSLLAEMQGRVELGLKAYWLEDVVFREIVRRTLPSANCATYSSAALPRGPITSGCVWGRWSTYP
jgi:Gas vesicle synthesis protein GvpL/GvpF